MICPYCDSLLKETPESGTCPNCGGALASKGKLNKKKFPTPPVGLYENHVGHHIEIGEDMVTFRKRPGLSGRLSIVEVVPYSELYAVSIVRPGRILSGFLSVRSKAKKYYPMPTKITKAIDDDMSISLDDSDYSRFYKVYEFLRQCVDIVKANDQ